MIDGETNQALRTVGVGKGPIALCHNPIQSRTYVANYDGCSISVLRDSSAGIEERGALCARRLAPAATIARGTLFLPRPLIPDTRTPIGLLDITGRHVLDLHPGANDVSRLAPGVYFIQERGVRCEGRATKIVIQR